MALEYYNDYVNTQRDFKTQLEKIKSLEKQHQELVSEFKTTKLDSVKRALAKGIYELNEAIYVEYKVLGNLRTELIAPEEDHAVYLQLLKLTK